jgi:HdeA/HdeB family
MSRLGQAWLALSFSAAAVLPAHAQVKVEMTMITCEQYILFAMGDPKDISMWLSGYYSAKRNNTAFDVQVSRITHFEGQVIGLFDGLPAGTSRAL